MKFKADKGTETYNKLKAVLDKVHECRDAAKKIVLELGAQEIIEAYQGAAGGISGIVFKTCPSGWKKVGHKHFNDLYFPMRRHKANKDLIDRIEALPIVKQEEINDTVGYEPEYFGMIGIYQREDFILFDVPVERINGENLPYTYSPPADVVELTYSEFERLKAVPEPVSE